MSKILNIFLFYLIIPSVLFSNVNQSYTRYKLRFGINTKINKSTWQLPDNNISSQFPSYIINPSFTISKSYFSLRISYSSIKTTALDENLLDRNIYEYFSHDRLTIMDHILWPTEKKSVKNGEFTNAIEFLTFQFRYNFISHFNIVLGYERYNQKLILTGIHEKYHSDYDPQSIDIEYMINCSLLGVGLSFDIPIKSERLNWLNDFYFSFGNAPTSKADYYSQSIEVRLPIFDSFIYINKGEIESVVEYFLTNKYAIGVGMNFSTFSDTVDQRSSSSSRIYSWGINVALIYHLNF